MALLRRLASSSLLGIGILLVFAGISAALGFSITGMVASVATIAALLYAGGVWFGSAPAVALADGADTVIVFDRSLRIAVGTTPGSSVLLLFPEPLRAEIDAQCRAALRGEHTHFFCDHDGRRLSFDVAPVPKSDGAVMYGVLVCGSGIRAATAATSPLTTVA